MTEAEWMQCADPEAMLAALYDNASDRKLTLCGCAFCRTIWPLITNPLSQRAVEVVERSADGLASEEELREAGLDALMVAKDCEEKTGYVPEYFAADAAAMAFEGSGHFCAERAMYQSIAAVGEDTQDIISSRHCSVIRDIFGNPFRAIAFDPRWVTPTVRALAEGVYYRRASAPLPVLADAMQDAGCEDAAILDHLRGPGPHVRGCWVIDLVLGKA